MLGNGDKRDIRLQLVVVHVSMWDWTYPEQLGHQCFCAWVSTLPRAHTAPTGPKSTKCYQEFSLQLLCVPGTVRSEKQLMSLMSWSWGSAWCALTTVCAVCVTDGPFECPSAGVALRGCAELSEPHAGLLSRRCRVLSSGESRLVCAAFSGHISCTHSGIEPLSQWQYDSWACWEQLQLPAGLGKPAWWSLLFSCSGAFTWRHEIYLWQKYWFAVCFYWRYKCVGLFSGRTHEFETSS